MFIFLAIVALGTTAVIQAAGNTKTYPGFTVFDKDGEYLKLIGYLHSDRAKRMYQSVVKLNWYNARVWNTYIGPLYLRFKLHLDTFPPYSMKSTLRIQAVITPTVDILSLFLNGTVFFEKMPVKYFDDYDDTCLYHWVKCPHLKSKPNNVPMEVKVMETGIIPGWYEGAIDASTVIKGKRLRLAGLKFKAKIRDAS